MIRIWVSSLVEALVLGVVGVYLYQRADTKNLGELVLLIGGIAVLHRVLTIFDNASLSRDVSKPIIEGFDSMRIPLIKASEIVDLSSRSNFNSIGDLLSEYMGVREEKLAAERQKIVDGATGALRQLRMTLRTPVLEEPDFYSWLYSEFDKAAPSTRIEIVSMDEALEWTETHQEREYFKCNVNAAKRGVTIERIFFFSDKRLKEAAENKFVFAHREGNDTGLIGRRVDTEHFRRVAGTAVSAAGQGFILVNDRFAIVDVFSDDGKARGYITFDDADLKKYRKTFQSFKSLSGPLRFPQK